MEMSGDTVVAISNSFTVAIQITAKVKLQVRRALEARGVKSNLVMIRMFVGAIVLAMRGRLTEVTDLILDEEYTGYEAVIKSLLLDRIRDLGGALTPHNVRIAQIGKQSPAHRAAIQVTRRQAKADQTPTARELLEVC
jgi:hypothetical protein